MGFETETNLASGNLLALPFTTSGVAGLTTRCPPPSTNRFRGEATARLYCNLNDMKRVLVSLLLLVPQGTLRIKVSLVTAGVRVTDSSGRNVLGLRAQDFTIFDDGIPQKIEFLSSEEQTIKLGVMMDRNS